MNVARKKTRLNLPNLNVEAWIGSDRRVELETPDGEEFGGGHVEQLAFRAILNVLKTAVRHGSAGRGVAGKANGEGGKPKGRGCLDEPRGIYHD